MYDHGGMNRAYRLIWNRAKGLWIVAPEKAKGGGYAVGAVALAGLVVGLTAAPGGAKADPAATALPTGGKVVAGSVAITENGAAMTVTQGSARGIVNWNSFDVGSSAAVTFKQPDAASVTLNRVTGGAGSVIAGTMNANGKVYVVNPAGVLFSKSAQVNVGGLVASTADIANQDFLAGKEVFTAKGETGSVVNQGTITAKDGGAVVLIGGTVSNQGTINARGGDAVLASGAKVTLNAGANGHLKIEVDGATTAALVENGGLISASGGRVLMTAQGASAAVSSVVANTGTVEARTIGGKAGTVALLAGMQGGEVKVGGTIDASAPASTNRGGGNGGAVETSAAKVTVAPGAKVTTLAAKGKTGNWLIDPHDVTISAAAGSGGFTATTDDTVINVTTLTNALASTGVTVSTGSTGTQTGNITVAAPISWSANTTLTLNAAGSVFIDKDVTATGTSAGLALTFGTGYELRNGARVTLSGVGSGFAVNGAAYTMIRDATALQGIGSGIGLYALAQGIDASATSGWNSGAGFVPITGFDGTFAGLGHTVDRLTINRPGQAVTGMFALTSGTLRDLTLSNVSIVGSGTVGSVAARLSGGSISNAHVTGSVTGNADQVGGLVGWNDLGTITGSSSAATVSGAGETGGLVGRQRVGSITDSYATGAVTGTSDYVGGLIGDSSGNASLTNVYASGKVTGTTNVGGLSGGKIVAGTVTTTGAYWDTGSTGQSTSDVGTGIATANARTQATYTGFDFTNTWVMIAGETRPMLRSQYSTVITTPAALQLMAQDRTVGYKLGADINFGTAFTADGGGNYAGLWGAGGFVPVGGSGAHFTGSFDGQNHTITGLAIDRPSTTYVGLFGYAGTGAAISNVTLSGGTVTGKDNVGSLVGYLLGGTVTRAASGATVVGTGAGGEVGGLIGVNDAGTITSSSASGGVTSPGYDVGGLLGINVNAGTVTTSFATGSVTGTGTSGGQGNIGGLVGTNGYNAGTGGTISQSYATGAVSTAIGPAGGLVGFSQGAITDSYATGRVTGTGSASNIGGFIGVNSNDGTIANAYSTGQVTGPSQIGGFAGYNNNLASAITNAYWNSQTSGLGTGISGGGGGITARTTAQLQGALPTGFSGTIWGTGTNLYPYFGWSYGATPVAVSGKAYSDAGTTALAGATVTAVSNGASIGSAASGADGYYYILGAAGSINAAGALSYLDNHATKGAAFNDTVAATGITGLDIYGSAVRLATGKSSLSATRTGYASTFGSFSDTDLSFLSGSSFAPLTTTAGYGVYLDAASNYSLNGSLGSGGLLSLGSGGTFGVGGTVGLTAAGALTVNAPLSWSDAAGLTLTTTSAGNVTLGGAVSASLGSLTVAAGGTATSSAAVAVHDFRLTGGTWSQIAGTLPAFGATDFRLTSGATFLRATGGTGSAGTPYQIADVYGLQGMGSTSLAANSFRLAGAIDASGATTWNAGAGFSPIGTGATPFTGALDGQGNTISDLTISRSGSDDVGLFGVVGTGGTLGNIRLSLGSVAGRSRVGTLAGRNQGTITGSSSTGGAIGTGSDVGGLVGENDGGSIATSFATGAVAGSGSHIGGLAGANIGGGSVQNAYATGSVTGNAVAADGIGGLVGLNDGTATIVNGYATGAVGTSGTGTVIGGLIGQVSGGTVTGSVWNTASSGRSVGVGAGSASGVTGLDATGMTTLSNFTGAGWSADDQGGTASTWRVYDGKAAPLLRGFLTGLTVTGGAGSKTYDGSVNATNVGTLTYNPNPYTTAQVMGTATYTANGSNAGVYSGTDLTLGGLYSTQFGYDISTVSGTLTVDKAPLTVTANDAAKTYDGLAYGGGTGVRYGGFVNGETSAVLGGTLVYGGTAQGAVNAGSYSFTVSGLSSGNYAIGYAAGTLTVNKAALTVTANDAAKTYDGLAYDGGTGIRYSGFVNGETSAVLGGTLAYGGTAPGAVNAGSYSFTASGLSSGNYDIGYAAGTLTVNKAALTVTANDATKTYDGLAHIGGNGVRYSGFVNGETSAVLGGTLAYGGTAQGAVNAGAYTLSASGLSSGNYDIGYAAGTLTVNKAALTVTANDAAKTYDGLAYIGGNGVRYSGFVNGETSAVLGGTLAYGGTAQGAVGAGGYTLGASGLSSGNYSIGYAGGTLTVNKAALTVTANDAAKTYDGLAYAGGNGVRYGGFVNGETSAVLGGTLAYGGTAQGAVDAGGYTLGASGLSSDNYSIGYIGGTLTVNKAVLTVTADSQTAPLRSVPASLTYSVGGDGFGHGDTTDMVFSGALATTADPTSPGLYSISQGTLTLNSGNYTLGGFSPGTLTMVATSDAPTSATLNRATRLFFDSEVADGASTDDARSVKAEVTPSFQEPFIFRSFVGPVLFYAQDLIKIDR
ncbi:MBG domain-containing protein [Azospirillum doebereinerae]